MPELPEVETYRLLAEQVVGRRIRDVLAHDPWFVRGGASLSVLRGQTVTAARRRGKLLVLDTGPRGHRLGLRFGMTGRLLVDGSVAIDKLEYSSGRDDPSWHRFALRFSRSGSLVVSDPRRLGSVELDPDEDRLGPDALTVTRRELRNVLAGSAAPLKARLLDQARLAGVGNLLADELLWRAGLDPARPAGSLTAVESTRLHRHLVATIVDLAARGGSHLGDLGPERRPGGRCPRDGSALVRRTVGGRTTWSCPTHQH